MKVFKFGGASVKDANGIKNLSDIIKKYETDKILVVVSAIGKTTNALESLLAKSLSGTDYTSDLNDLKNNHVSIALELLHSSHVVFNKIESIFIKIDNELKQAKKDQYDFYYDQIVSKGELLSTTIVASYIQKIGLNSLWLDAREYVKTDATYRTAKVNIAESVSKISKIKEFKESFFITQGFIGGAPDSSTTTLGREGSDYTAAIFAYALQTEEVTIWKDVDGVFNADPKIFSKPELIHHLSYKEAIELAFYGASVIHPKTIQPLSERDILLNVKSFYKPESVGTVVSNATKENKRAESVIVKKNQLLLSLVPRNLSFTDLPNMTKAMEILSKHRHQVNIIQNSAVSFSLCLDANVYHFDELLKELNKDFLVKYNTNLVLVTIRNYHADFIDQVYEKARFKLEQRNRSTYQILVDEKEFEEVLFPMLDAN